MEENYKLLPQLTSSDVVNFYNQTEYPYGVFSNFSPHPVTIGGATWPTTEHYFQAMKFHPHSPADVKAVRVCGGPGKAASLGRDRSRPLRKDWEAVKDQIMFTAVLEKFTAHKDLKMLILSTGDATLVEHTGKDSYWGDGGDGSGKNMLGITLMKARAVIRAHESTTATTWNRQRDKLRIESTIGLPEFPPLAIGGETSSEDHFTFVSLNSADAKTLATATGGPTRLTVDSHLVLARGYSRIVYGDHGPYVELLDEHINWAEFPEKNESKKSPERYYDEFFAPAAVAAKGHPVMLYAQLRDVKGKMAPPRDGKAGSAFHSSAKSGTDASASPAPAAVADETAPEFPGSVMVTDKDGYADYRVGRFYLDPDDIRVIPPASYKPPAATAEPAGGADASAGATAKVTKKKKNRLQ